MAQEDHPKLGDNTTVEPIRDLKDIASIKRLLHDSPRDLLLFTLGVNTGLRMGDLLRLTVGQVRGVKLDGTVKIKEQKTRKHNEFRLNSGVYPILQKYLKANPDLPDDSPLFPSRKNPKKAVGIDQISRLISEWCRAINLAGRYGCHTCRKTWGYHQRVTFGTDIATIAKRFNHRNPAITMRYLGITDQEVADCQLNVI